MFLNKRDLIIGEIYYYNINNKNNINILRYKGDGKCSVLMYEKQRFDNRYHFNFDGHILREASDAEKHYFKQCEK
jgi:hypothetical protein